MRKQFGSSALFLMVTVIWGSAFVFQDMAMAHIGPFSVQAIRCLLAVLALLIIIIITDCFKKDGKTFFSRWADPKLWKAGLLCGIPLTLACNLQQLGLGDTDPGKCGFLTSMYIVIVPIFGLIRGKKLGIMVPIGVVMSVVGLYFLCLMESTSINIGDLLTLGCAFMFAVQINFVDMFAGNTDPLRLNTIQALVCSVVSAIIMLFTETPTLTGITNAAFPLFFTGVLSFGIGYYVQIVAQKNVDATAATLIMSMEAVFAVVFEMILLNQMLTKWELIGSALMLIAVIIAQLPVGLKKSSKQAKN
jgi:drug/metabolite transporter (DMT)-like permease